MGGDEPGRKLRLLICGARSFAEEVAGIAAQIPGVELEGFVENERTDLTGGTLLGKPVHWVEDIAVLAESHHAVCAFGTTKRIRFTEQVDALGVPWATLVHPSAVLAPSTELGEGCIVGAGAIVGAHTRIGRHTILNRGALVGHHTNVGHHVSLQPGSNVAGHCRVGSRTFVGMGALVLNGVSVGERSVVGAGSLVLRDVPDRVQAVGSPAKVVKEGIDGL